MILFIALPCGHAAAIIHDGGWCLKVLLLASVSVGTFWMPLEVFLVWANIARWASIPFLLMQAFFILVSSYEVNAFMLSIRTEGRENLVFGQLLLYTGIFTALTITLLVKSFQSFTGFPAETYTKAGLEEPSCGTNATLSYVTIGMVVIVMGLHVREDSSIFTSSIVNLWLTYLLYSALASRPDPVCNTLYG